MNDFSTLCLDTPLRIVSHPVHRIAMTPVRGRVLMHLLSEMDGVGSSWTTSQADIAKAVGASRTAVQDFLRELRTSDHLTITSDRRGAASTLTLKRPIKVLISGGAITEFGNGEAEHEPNNQEHAQD